VLETGRWFALAAAVCALDQWTKHLAQQHLVFGQAVPVTPFFDLVLVFNPGAAFSFLSSASGWQRELFIVIALAASAFMSHLIVRHRARRLFAGALGLILGGAIGNVIDRFVLHAVVDFVHLHVGAHSWPAFNAADAAITCGAVLMILDSLRDRSRPQPDAPFIPPGGRT
jgi:signal peptidase II